MTTHGRQKAPRGARRPSGESRDMHMATVEELRRRIESLENHNSGIGSEVAVVKAEVGSMQRDINYLRTSAETMGSKLDTVLTNISSIQTTNSFIKPRDPLELIKSMFGIVVSVGAVMTMFFGAIMYISSNNTDENSAKIKEALLQRLLENQQAVVVPKQK